MTVNFENVVTCAPELDVQLTIMCVFAVIFYFAMPYSAKNIVRPFVESKSWGEQWSSLQKRTLEKQFKIKFDSNDDAFNFICLSVAIIIQHCIGGFLCFPAMVFGPGGWRSSFACLGGLCEAGWELQDLLTRFYWLISGTHKELNPPPLMILMTMHHMMGLSLVIPMNLYYRDEPYYHEFVFLLQAAAFISFSCTYYGYTLNVKKSGELFQMKCCAFVTWAVIAWSRVIRYLWVGYMFLGVVYADGNMSMFYMGITAILSMAVMNTLFFLDATAKLMKFLPMKVSDEGVDEAGVMTMRASHHRLSFSLPMGLSKAQKGWSKVRGGVMMGVIKETKKDN